MAISGIGSSYNQIGVTTNYVQEKEPIKDAGKRVAEQPVRLSISDEGKEYYRNSIQQNQQETYDDVVQRKEQLKKVSFNDYGYEIQKRAAQQNEDITKFPSMIFGNSGIMNDFEKNMSELGGGTVSNDLVSKNYSQESVDVLKAKFEKEEGTKTDTFDSYVNKMASAYQLMQDRIEEKYAATDRQREYYIAADGSTQELTKEKELETLDNAYEAHSKLMATSTQIWSELQDFKVQINYHSSMSEIEKSATKNQNAGVKEQAYHAFMSAINEKNSGLLKQEKGNRNHLRSDLGISSSARNFLNSIWDYYANLEH